jgi:hypothetical protein
MSAAIPAPELALANGYQAENFCVNARAGSRVHRTREFRSGSGNVAFQMPFAKLA